jgi:hypothetical protein
MWFQLCWDTSWINLSTWLGHQPTQSFNLVGTSAYSIFQLCWDTSLLSLQLVGTPADSIFQLGGDNSQFSCSTQLGQKLIYLRIFIFRRKAEIGCAICYGTSMEDHALSRWHPESAF